MSNLFGTATRSPRPWLLGAATMFAAGPVLADALGNSNELLCYGLTATVCTIDGETCDTMEPWELNLPDFVRLDLRARVVASTDSAGEKRQTPIASLERENGYVYMQGLQNGRAYSWVIAQSTGEGTMTINTFDTGVTIFTVCTPD